MLTYYVTVWPVGSTLVVTEWWAGGEARKRRFSWGLRTHSLLFTDHNIASLGHLNLIFNFRDIPNIRQERAQINV